MKNKFKSFLLVFFAFLFLAVFIGFARFVLVKEVATNELYVPSQSQLVLKIQGKEILKTSFYDLFLQHPDAEIFSLLRNLTQKEAGKPKIKDSGIDFLADVLIFNYPTTKGDFFGFIFQLNNSNSFQKNFLSASPKNTGGISNAQTGIFLLFKPTNPNHELSKETIEREAFKILNNPRKEKYFTQRTSKDDSFLVLETKAFTGFSPALGKGFLSFHIKDSTLEINGKFASKSSPSQPNWNLKPQGFHFSSSLLTVELKDSIQSQLKKQGFVLPRPAKIAFNYAGLQMGNGGIIPKMDLLLGFDSIVPKNNLLDPKLWRKFGFTISKNTAQEYALNNGKSEFKLIFLDEYTFFIGSSTASLEHQVSNRLFYLTGDASYLTKIEGGGLVAMSLNLYPPFKTSKDFLESLKTSDLEIYTKGRNSFIRGDITFREGKSVTVEILRLLLKTNEF